MKLVSRRSVESLLTMAVLFVIPVCQAQKAEPKFRPVIPKMWDDAEMATLELPLANPADYAEFEFEAAANQTYAIWVRGQNLDGRNTSDAFWMQFDDEIGTTTLGAGHNHPKGFGNWLDRFPAHTSAWSSALPQDAPQTISFARAGKHRLRIQPRQPRHVLEQIWLSATVKALPPPSQPAASSLRRTTPPRSL